MRIGREDGDASFRTADARSDVGEQSSKTKAEEVSSGNWSAAGKSKVPPPV